jgi:hypothetical protein
VTSNVPLFSGQAVAAAVSCIGLMSCTSGPTRVPLPQSSVVIQSACHGITRAVASKAIGVPLPDNNAAGLTNDQDGCEYDATGDQGTFVKVDRYAPALRVRSLTELQDGNVGADRLDGLPNGAIAYRKCGDSDPACGVEMVVGGDTFLVTVAARQLTGDQLRAAVTTLATALARSAKPTT